MASEKKPIDKGFLRSVKIIGGAAGVGLLVVGAFAFMGGGDNASSAPASNVGKIVPQATGEVQSISPAALKQLERVQREEAEAARRAGRSYIPDSTLGPPTPITTQAPPTPPAPAPVSGPPQTSYGQYQQNQRRATQRNEDFAAIEAGLTRQIAALAASMQPASAVDVVIKDMSNDQPGAAAGGARGAGATGAPAGNKDMGPLLVGGDEIVPGLILTPIDTYKTTFVLAEISGGPLAGAQLRGKVVPMTQSGDVEDVGLQFTSMRLNNKWYSINAIALNEQTANDAMDGSVDRRTFSRFVMPVLMAGLSGVSTYFTARGTPATSVATDVGSDSSVIVNQDRANREDAKNQGIGDAIDKAVQTSDRMVQKEANRPMRVTVDSLTPIGIMFNAPVYEGDAGK